MSVCAKVMSKVGLIAGAPAGIPGPDLQVIWIPKLIPGPVKIPVTRYLYLQVKYLQVTGTYRYTCETGIEITCDRY